MNENDLYRSLENLESRVRVLEATVKKLSGGGSSKSSAKSGTSGDVFGFEKLGGEWADKEIRKDPPMWIKDGGRPYAGSKYSVCPPEYLDKLAEFFDWKATKGEADPNPTKKDNGKFWYEEDRFQAKLIRTWAAFGRQNASRAVPATSDDIPW